MLVWASVLESQRALIAATGGGPFLGPDADLRACRLNRLFIGSSPVGGPNGSRLQYTLLRCVSEGSSRAVASDEHPSPLGEAEAPIESFGTWRVQGNPEQRAGVQVFRRWSAEWITIRCWLGRSGRHDRRCRFDQREGHDLERLLWPVAGSGGSTGLLQN